MLSDFGGFPAAAASEIYHVRELEELRQAVVGCVEDLAPLMLGRDPRDIENGVRAMTKHGFWKLGVIGRSAIAGIEQAMWDIFGKSVGLPVWRLLGGKKMARHLAQELASAASLQRARSAAKRATCSGMSSRALSRRT